MSRRIVPDWEIRDAIIEAGGADAHKCYQCGKCMVVCPWNQVDAVVFPVHRTPQAVRLGAILASEDAAEVEREVDEVFRCVGCESCSTRCPHGVSLPDIIRAIRRILVDYGSCPAELMDAISRIQSSGNPFGEPREKRLAFAEGLAVAGFESTMEYLYFPCCVSAYDPRASVAARAALSILRDAGVSFGLLGEEVVCCGESIRRAGAEEVFQEVAQHNIAAFRDAGVRRVVVSSPHCSVAFTKHYRELGADFEVVHQTQLIHRLLMEGRISPPGGADRKVLYHDPCTLGRQGGVYLEPRELLSSVAGVELVESEDSCRERGLCCGGGSGGVWLERPKEERMAALRVRQAGEVGADLLAVACPYCLQMFEDAVKTFESGTRVLDVVELLAGAK